jgi:Ala-tRNA(Pro) deacylase
MPTATVFERLCARLDQAGVAYEVSRHAPVRTSEEAAAVRGTPLSSGAKALLCKAGEDYALFVMPADRRLDGAVARRALGAKRLRFASAEEVATVTALAPGAIPPFGSLFGLSTWCDERLAEEPRINFNAGDRAISLGMNVADYLAVERPTLGRFTQE